MVFSESQLGEGMFPDELLDEYNRIFTEPGVKIISEKNADRYRRDGNQLILELDDGSEVSGDAIVIGLGVEPRIELAKRAGLEISKDGVVVNDSLQSSNPSIYVSADIATYPDKILGQQRIEHVDHARHSGKQAGAIMAGGARTYSHTPYLYSEIYDLRWEAIGTLDPSFETLFDRRKNGAIVFYLDSEKLKGVLLWNVEIELDKVRALLDNPPADKEKLIGLLEEQESQA